MSRKTVQWFPSANGFVPSLHIDTIYSPDDKGHYAEVVETQTGKTLHTTRVFREKYAATCAAERWINKYLA